MFYRDVWSDETLQNVIQCSFLFLQFLLESEEGSKYVRLYKVRILRIETVLVLVFQFHTLTLNVFVPLNAIRCQKRLFLI